MQKVISAYAPNYYRDMGINRKMLGIHKKERL